MENVSLFDGPPPQGPPRFVPPGIPETHKSTVPLVAIFAASMFDVIVELSTVVLAHSVPPQKNIVSE